MRVSERHGVNPMIPKCFFCNKDKNEIVLFGVLPGDQEAPKGVCVDKQPCDECAGYMKMGVVLISCKDGDEGTNNPYRTGGWVVIKDDAIRRMVRPESLAESILRARVCFVPDTAWDQLGLPRG